MTKKKFLLELKSKLKVLSEDEIKDILNEYESIIEEKVKNGKTETEAINDFGDIDVLADALLEAYKLNPNYKNDDKKETVSARTLIDDAEELIKKGAKKLSDVANNIAEDMKKNDRSFTTEEIFEMVIKVIILLIGLAILRIPFYIIEELLKSILSINIGMIDWIFVLVIKLVIWIAYFAVAAIIIVTFFKKYFNEKGIMKSIKTGIEKEVEKSHPEEYRKYESEKKEVKKETHEKERHSNNSTITEVIIMIAKIFLFLMFVLPLIFANIGIWCAIAINIYFLIKGLPVFGLLILLVGAAIVFGIILNIVKALVFDFKTDHKTFSIVTFIIGFILIIIGGLMSLETIFKYNYIDNIPKDRYQTATQTFSESINGKTRISVDGKKEIIIDSNLSDNQIKIEVDNYKFSKVRLEKDFDEIEIDSYQVNYNREMFDLIIDGLKDYKIYNYSKYYELKVRVYVNENTRDLVR